MMQRRALDYFPQNALGDGPTFWIVFQDSRIRVNNSSYSKLDPRQCMTFGHLLTTSVIF